MIIDDLFSEKNEDDWRGLPQDIQAIGLQWGLMDAVFRDEAFVAIKDDPDRYNSKIHET